MEDGEPIATTCRILSLDGGGAKGFYTLGVLNQLEALLGSRPLCEGFDVIFGTSTGAMSPPCLDSGRPSPRYIRFTKTTFPGLCR